jgi:hypothetical protein
VLDQNFTFLSPLVVQMRHGKHVSVMLLYLYKRLTIYWRPESLWGSFDWHASIIGFFTLLFLKMENWREIIEDFHRRA